MLPSCRRFPFPSAYDERGLTRVEILVIIVLVLILFAVGFGPVTECLDKHNVGHTVEKARILSTLLSQYATDNNGVYPVGENTPVVGKSEGIARNLLENNYTPNASIFAVGSTTKYGGKTSDYSDLAPGNLSWDFTAGATATTGVTSAASDLLPIAYTTGETVAYPKTAGAGLSLALTGNGPFGTKGIVVAYKNNSAQFIPATSSGTGLECQGFISTDFKDTAAYTQIKP